MVEVGSQAKQQAAADWAPAHGADAGGDGALCAQPAPAPLPFAPSMVPRAEDNSHGAAGAEASAVPSVSAQHGAGDASSGEAGAGRKRGRQSQADDKARDKSTQEKNRQAQARFRQRQRAVEVVFSRATPIASAPATTPSKRQRLQARVVAQDKLEAYEAEVRALRADRARLVDENRTLINRRAIMERIVAMKDDQLQMLQDRAELQQREAWDGSGAAVANGATAALPGSAVPGSTCPRAEELMNVWKDGVRALSGLFLKLDTAGDDGEVLSQIDALMSETMTTCHKMALHDPGAGKVLVSTSMDVSEAAEPSPEHWATIMSQLELAADQHDMVGTLLRSYRTDMAECARARQTAVDTLAAMMPDLESSATQCRNSLAAARAVVQLQGELRREHRIHIDFVAAILDRVFTKLQLAQASVTCYPRFPDALRMCASIATLACEPDPVRLRELHAAVDNDDAA